MLSEEDAQRIAQFESVLEWARAGYAMPMTGYYDLEWLVNKLRSKNAEIMILREQLKELKEELKKDPCKCLHEKTTHVDNLQGGVSEMCDNCESEILHKRDACNCVGVSHDRDCQFWVLPF